jgi:hypothetical protein
VTWTGRWFSPDTLVSTTNKSDHHGITEILLKVALNTIKQTFLKKKIYLSKLFNDIVLRRIQTRNSYNIHPIKDKHGLKMKVKVNISNDEVCMLCVHMVKRHNRKNESKKVKIKESKRN